MNCPECEREVYSGSCRCGWRAPLLENSVQARPAHTCKTPGCDRMWTINGYCRECYVEGRSRDEPASDEVARDAITQIRRMIGRVSKPLPYDKNRRQA